MNLRYVYLTFTYPKVWGEKDDVYYGDLVLVLVLGCALTVSRNLCFVLLYYCTVCVARGFTTSAGPGPSAINFCSGYFV